MKHLTVALAGAMLVTLAGCAGHSTTASRGFVEKASLRELK